MGVIILLRHHPAICWLCLIQCVSMGAMEMSAPFWILHLQSYGLSSAKLSWFAAWIYAGPIVTAMLCTPWWGGLGDRIGHHWMLIRALGALALTQAWLSACTELEWILCIRLLQGAIAGFLAASQSYGCHLTSSDERPSLMAALQASTAIGSALGPMAGGYLYPSYGLASINLLAALLCFFSLWIAWIILPSTPSVKPIHAANNSSPELKATSRKYRHTTHSINGTPTHWRYQMLWGLLVGILLIQTAKMLPQSFYALYVSEVLHEDTKFIGLSYGLTAIGLCICAPIWADALKRWPHIEVRTSLVALCGLSAVILVVQSLWTYPFIFLTCRFLWGALLGALLPAFYSLISIHSPHQHQGRALAWGNSAAKGGALLGLIFGSIMMWMLPIHTLFLLVALTYGIAAWCLIRLPLGSCEEVSSHTRSSTV